MSQEKNRSVVIILESLKAPPEVCEEARRRFEGCLPCVVNPSTVATKIERWRKKGLTWQSVVEGLSRATTAAYKGENGRLRKIFKGRQ